MELLKKSSNMNILIFLLGSIGDTVISIPSIQEIINNNSRHNPNVTIIHEISTFTTNSPKDVLCGMYPDFNYIGFDLYSHNKFNINKCIKLINEIRSHKFDFVFYLAPSERTFTQIIRDKIFFKLCNVRSLIGFHSYSYSDLYPINPDGTLGTVEHESILRMRRLRRTDKKYSDYMDFNKPFLQLPKGIIENAFNWIQKNRKYPDKKIVGICIGTKQPANFWPVENFLEVCQYLINEEKYELVFIGGPAEVNSANILINKLNSGIDGTGIFTVLESAAILKNCDFIIGLDTGTTHLAAAQGVSCIAIYGERDNPGRFTPIGSFSPVLRSSVPCAGCRLVHAPCNVIGHPCMNNITALNVIEAVKYLLIKKLL